MFTKFRTQFAMSGMLAPGQEIKSSLSVYGRQSLS